MEYVSFLFASLDIIVNIFITSKEIILSLCFPNAMIQYLHCKIKDQDIYIKMQLNCFMIVWLFGITLSIFDKWFLRLISKPP